jgi:hypothetical protein
VVADTTTTSFIVETLNPVTILTVTVTVVGSVYKIVDWFNKKSEAKTEHKAAELKILRENGREC